MLGRALRNYSNTAISKFAVEVAKTGINPFVFTGLAILWAIAAAIALWQGLRVVSIPLVLVAGAWDAIDGAVARAQGKHSLSGKYIEGIIDKWVEVILYAGLFFGGYQLESILMLASSTTLSLAKPRLSLVIPSDNHDWPGIGDRADRITLLVIALIASALVPEFRLAGSTIHTLSLSLYLLATVLFVGHLQRVRYGMMLVQLHLRREESILERDQLGG